MKDIDWTFDGTWPHPPRWFDTPEGRMHYVDVGERGAPPVVLVHGNPSWGYLFRNFIGPLVAAGHRVIVPDHLGFGRSDKPAAGAHRIDAHARRFAAFLDSLDLHHCVITLHDWGGPIALDWVTRNVSRVERLILMQTFAYPPDRLRLPLPLRLFRIPGLGELLVQGFNLIVRAFLLGGGITRRERVTPVLKRAYLTPHPTFASRAGMLALARQYPALDYQNELARRLRATALPPTLLVWAGRDEVLGHELARLRRELPDAHVVTFPESGHFLQEDAHERVVPELLAFI